MAVITTEQLMKEYFAEQERQGKDVRRNQSQLDRPEVYAYEQKIGKQLVEFDADEILEMISTFQNKKNKFAYAEEGPKMSANSYKRYISGYKQIFLFYVKHHELVRSPYDDPKLKGINIHIHRAESRDRLTWAKVEGILNRLSTKYEYERVCYFELIIRLFYDGFANAHEIINMKEADINTRRREVTVPGRIVRLSERTYQLLLENHKATQMDVHRTKMDMMSWHGSYMKFFVHNGRVSDFSAIDVISVARKITVPISSTIPKDFGISLSFRRLYLLGFYDYLVRNTSEERAKEMILAKSSPAAQEEFMALVDAYPVITDNVFVLKQSLVEFI